MSRDIRQFFTKSPKGNGEPNKQKSRVVQLSSDEDDTNAGNSNKQQKKSHKSSRRTISSGSEDEVQTVQQVAKNSTDKKIPKKEQLKPTALGDVFGKKPIKRVPAPAVSKKQQIKPQEDDFHTDDDFSVSLSKLDTSQFETEFQKSLSKDSSKRQNNDQSDDNPKTKKTREHDVSLNGNEESNGKDKQQSSSKTSSTSGESKKTKKATKSEIVVEITNKKTKKEKHEEAEAVDPYADGIEKKKQRAVQYDKYLQRGGARNPGSKIIPEGASNCLAGLSFVITGVLDSLEREEADELIKKYGGRVMAQVSKKTNYMIVGDEAGPSKLAKATSFGTKKISEDELLDMIKTKPKGKATDVVLAKKARKRSRSPEKVPSSPSPKKLCLPASDKTPPRKVEQKAESSAAADENISEVQKDSKALSDQRPSNASELKPEKVEQKAHSSTAAEPSVSNLQTDFKYVAPAEALVEKYRPKSMKQIIGQHGDKSNAKKLDTWLRNWNKNHNGTTKLTKPSPWAKNDDGAFFKACLLSGPPGIGKTTTAQVVCAEIGYDLLEFNASDTRSKRLLKEEVAGILCNTTVKQYFPSASSSKTLKQQVLLMDEVDGMAGNEDRGGLQELIALIKNSEIPIICTCNDRNNPKMRTLANYTFDLRFQKPRLEPIRGAMKSMCCKEKIDISTEDLDRLIISTNMDIRQVINHLAMLSTGAGTKKEGEAKRMNKDLKLGPWDVIRKVFSADEHKTMSIHDKSDLYFHDYNIAALFVQENYLSVVPKAPSSELIDRIWLTADSLATGDVMENAIRGSGAWSLLPTQACFSSVIPGSLMSGHMAGAANFPAWLGRNSKRGKYDRILQEITVHSRLVTGSSKEAINMDYLNSLRDSIIRPLALKQSDGIEEAVNAMNHYHLLRDDLESLVEVSLWPGQQDPLQAIDSKVKAAFTRAYNKSSAPAPYLMNAAAPKKKSNQASQDEGFMDGEEEDIASDGDDDDVGADRMIKAKKGTAASSKAASSSKTESKSAPKAASKRGRGRGKAR